MLRCWCCGVGVGRQGEQHGGNPVFLLLQNSFQGRIGVDWAGITSVSLRTPAPVVSRPGA